MAAVQTCTRRHAKKKWMHSLPTLQPWPQPSPQREALLSNNDVHLTYWKYARKSNVSTLLCKNRCGVIESVLSLISTTGGRPDFRKFSHKPFYTEAHNFSNIAPNLPIFDSIDIFSYHLSGVPVEIIKYAPQENLGFKEATILSVSAWPPLLRGGTCACITREYHRPLLLGKSDCQSIEHLIPWKEYDHFLGKCMSIRRE